jgi:hypothetical protein
MKDIFLNKAKFLLIGETHGIRENLVVLKIFVKIYFASNKKFIVAFEWPSSLTEEINEYLSDKAKSLSWQKWKFINDKDGRISKQHIQFLTWLKKENLKLPKNKRLEIKCFDENAKIWNKRDKMMAQNLGRSKVNTIAIMGKLHANKTKLNLDGEQYTPLAFSLVSKKMISIRINYLTGKFYNHGIKNLEKGEDLKLGLTKNNGLDFDYIYTIKEAQPISLLKKIKF